MDDRDGCPEDDADQDGIPDFADRCPLEAGPADNAGCPDTDRDGDGIVDRLDNCPDEKGSPENQGCAKKQLVTLARGKIELVDRVYFRTDEDLIERRSYAILDNLAQVVMAHPEIRQVRVEGHTDNRGGDRHNLDLSLRRAGAVVAYLVGKGVSRDRLAPVGLGQTRPIADNATDVGRATNRRVEFVVPGDTGANVEIVPTGPTDETIRH